MKIGVPKEIIAGERRVALAPDAVAKLVESGVEVVVETGAGNNCLLYTSPSPRDATLSRMPSSA